MGYGGERYDTGIPMVKLGRLRMAIKGVPNNPGGGKRKNPFYRMLIMDGL